MRRLIAETVHPTRTEALAWAARKDCAGWRTVVREHGSLWLALATVLSHDLEPVALLETLDGLVSAEEVMP